MNQIKDGKKIKITTITVVALLISLLSGFMAVKKFPERLEYMVSDYLYQDPGIIPDNIKIIAIDEETLGKLGPYSNWDRSYFAKLVEKLNADSEKAPRVIGIDVVFSGTDYSEEDSLLVEACKLSDNIVLASTLNFDTKLHKKNDTYYLEQFVSSEGRPYDALSKVADYGFTNAIFDDDGVIRSFYTKLMYSDMDTEQIKIYESFAYKIASRIDKIKACPSEVEVAFVGKPGDFETISMADVVEGKIPEGYFEDCIVLVGAYEEGARDSYRVSIDPAEEMFGVELQANYIYGLLNERIVYPLDGVWQFVLTLAVVFCAAWCILKIKLRFAVLLTCIAPVIYVIGACALFKWRYHTLNILAVPLGIVLAFLSSALLRYITMQKSRMLEMQSMLFSMAEAMAEAIEGRTPYNANHTKNVALRCVEMLDYINSQHKLKKTELHFTKEDKLQLYLAAMLHDVGKMDVPLEIMDKPTKLGEREASLKSRLEIIKLRIENDVLSGHFNKEDAEKKLDTIDLFVKSLPAFNCGRPLNEAEWALVDEMADSIYEGRDGTQIPYLSEEEKADLHIKAGTLSDKERNIMQSHVTYTDKILSHIQFGEHFDKVRSMASNHHELLNGRGYPAGINADELDVMTRILTIMDIYDSLIADDRPYKKAKPIPVAFNILDEEAEAGKIDKELLQYAKELYFKERTEE